MSDACAPKPNWNEKDRLKALESYDILDTPKEEDFEGFVKMAAQACNVPVSLISLVSSDRQWFKAEVGTGLSETPLGSSICSHAILQKDLFVVEDTTRDSRTRDNPLVSGNPNFRFYAGAVLETPEGLPLGTVCVLDYEPRTLTPQEANSLKILAKLVMTQLELRRSLAQLRRELIAREKNEGRLAFLASLTQKLSMLSSPEELNRVATREVGQFLGGNRCYFFEAIPPELHTLVLPDWCADGAKSLQGTYDLAEFGQPEMWKTLRSRSVTISDLSIHPWTQPFFENYQAMNIGAALIAPFCRDGRWVTCLGVSSEQPRQWLPDEQSLLENVLARVWPLIERARIENALKTAHTLLGDKAALLESIVQERTQSLSDTIEELRAYSYSISHDLRAPLRAMIGYSDILTEDYSPQLDQSGQEYLARIRNAGSRMDRLIQDVLVYSRLSGEDVVLESVDADTLIRDIIHSYPNLAPDVTDIVIKSRLPVVKATRSLLTQCFSNLLENGSKFVAPGVKPRMEVWGEAKDGRVRLFFKDNGIGISEQHQESIFNIFQRVGRDTDGTGIGLAIVRKAVEKMGGTMGVESKLGKGSLFWFDLQPA